MNKEKIVEQAERSLKEGKLDRALRDYEKLLAEDRSDMRTKLKIADIYARKKEISTATRLYREVAEEYCRENFHLKAIAVCKIVLKLSPTLVEINEKLGDLYHQVGLDSDAVSQYYIVASTYDHKGLGKEAMEIRKKILAIDPTNTTGRIRLAELMQAEGKTEESLREYGEAARILDDRKDREGLIEVYEKMLYFRPDNIEMLTKLCHIYFEKREFKRALARIESAAPELKKNPDVAELWAEALLEDRQVDAARRRFRELYLMILESGDAERSAKVYSRILQEFSDDQDYLNELEEARKGAGVEVASVTPKYRQDFEKTEMIDLNRLDENLKKK